MGRTNKARRRLGGWLALAISCQLTSSPLNAQTSTDTTPVATASDELALQQSELADRYARLEKLLLRMAEFDAADNPRRSELLKKAFALSKERNVQMQLEKLVEFLNQEKLARAVENQVALKADLQSLLDLLLTENRADRLRDEKTRIRNYIRELERIQRMQRSVQGRTEGGVDHKQVAKEQEGVADQTSELGREIARNEATPNDAADSGSDADEDQASDAAAGEASDSDSNENSGDQKTGEAPSGDAKPGDAKPGDESKSSDESPNQEDAADRPNPPSADSPSSEAPNQGQPGEPSPGEPSPGEPSPGEPSPGEPSPGQPSPGQPTPGQPSPGQPTPGQGAPPGENGEPSPDGGPPSASPPSEQFPGQQRIREAEQKMKDAQQKLAEALRKEAIQDQEDAARKLAEAKAELEEILRQLREEEIERSLALLESRFRKMLEMELQVYENTLRLYKIPAARRDRFVDIEAGKLSFQQRRIVVEADKCLALLREEGSSVAFPESVEQMRDDMEQVESRLGRAQIGRLTQGIEEDIIAALDEMVEALQQAQQDQEQRRSQQQQSMPAPSDEQALVDQIAELKMLKAMQLRINKRTKSYSRLLDDDMDVAGQATDDELIEALQELAARELRLQEITHDIVVGKNQ